MHASNAPGYDELTPIQQEYLDWLVDPEHSGSKAKWAHDHHLTPKTLYDWALRAPRFRRHLQRRLDELNIRPDRVQEVLDNLHSMAKSNGREAVAAAKAYLQYVEKLDPSRKPVEDRAIKDLSQEELLEQLESAVASQRQRNLKVVRDEAR